jgi:hypothetical protein
MVIQTWQERIAALAEWKPPEGVHYLIGFEPATQEIRVMVRACCACQGYVIPADAPWPPEGAAGMLDKAAAEVAAKRDEQHKERDEIVGALAKLIGFTVERSEHHENRAGREADSNFKTLFEKVTQ